METATTNQRTALQTYEFRTINRRDIKEAPYNPRVIQNENRARLKRGMQKFGLVETLVWNEETGNLVSGHQRLSILDETNKTLDYTVTVAAVRLTRLQEKALNVFLNNKSAQGEFDRDLFVELLSGEDTPSLSDMGFTELLLELELGPLPDLPGRQKAAKTQKPVQRQTGPSVEAASERTYFLLIFNSDDEKRRFMEHNGFGPASMHMTGLEFESLLESSR